ncbi:YbaB/EbfC family nucleoid-associated protein [Nocardia harenae]|uniref:YbaB/EbfC family nucleoid-associated protein n=1 Tax=Nocardia harenae TaxID=358707 RepID=UPI00082F2A5A|nr:YbaB/EbfC family nucleoid-associated protein [Nocardia harenae]
MPNENAEAMTAGLLADFRSRMAAIAQAQQRRAQLTATATARGKRVSVTVNADGVVIDVTFSAHVDDLRYDEIAKAVVAAGQEAAAEVAREARELAVPLLDERARLPKFSEIVDGMPDFAGEIPVAPSPPTTPPNSADRIAAEQDAAATGYAELEDSRPGGGVSESGW